MPDEKQQVEEISATEWLNEVLKQAIRMNASDIHIVPSSHHMAALFRIDGVMQEIDRWHKENHETVLSRLKVVSGLSVVEKQLPQDGHLEILLNWTKQEQAETENEKSTLTANFRVSIMPTIHGEVAVLRALNRRNMLTKIDRLGMSEEALKTVRGFLRKSHGMVLVTGHTGSGKTTTMYALINEIVESAKTILTLEDPVEYNLDNVRQTQINPNGDLDFSTGLRAILRQDPDVVMIGEVRDDETAETAVRAALAGRLMLSTFHSTDIAGVIIRLLDLEVGRSMIASAMSGIITQRLVRKICGKCAREVDPSPEKLAVLGVGEWTHGKVKEPQGCEACNNTGYEGRLGIFEILEMNDEIKNLIISHANFDAINETVSRTVLSTLTRDGLDKVRRGVTTLDEVIKAVI